MFSLLVHKKSEETAATHAKLPLEKMLPAEELQHQALQAERSINLHESLNC